MWTTALACYFSNSNKSQLNSHVSCYGVLVSAPWGTLSGWSLSFCHVSVGENRPRPTQCVSGYKQTSRDITVTSQSEHTHGHWFPKMSPNLRLFSTLTQMLQLPISLWPQAFWETQSRSHDAESRKPIHQSPSALPQSLLHSCYWLEDFSTHQTQNSERTLHNLSELHSKTYTKLPIFHGHALFDSE